MGLAGKSQCGTLSCRRRDEVMSKAIEELFPNTCRHWNIQKNSTSRLGAFAGGLKAFNKMFTKCMQGCDSEVVSEETWANNKLLKRWTRDKLLVLTIKNVYTEAVDQRYPSSGFSVQSNMNHHIRNVWMMKLHTATIV